MNKFLAWIVTAFLTFAIMLSLLATASAFAAEPESAQGTAVPRDRGQASAEQTDRVTAAAASSPRALVNSSAARKQANGKRVYLEDFQLIHKPVTQQRSTKMVVLGKSKRPD